MPMSDQVWMLAVSMTEGVKDRWGPHIDVAKSFAAYSSENGELPEWLGYDGLHEDVIGKQLIAARVNAEWETAVQAADEWFKQ